MLRFLSTKSALFHSYKRRSLGAQPASVDTNQAHSKDLQYIFDQKADGNIAPYWQ